MVSVKKMIKIADNNKSYRRRKSATLAIYTDKLIPYINDGINNKISIYLHETAFKL